MHKFINGVLDKGCIVEKKGGDTATPAPGTWAAPRSRRMSFPPPAELQPEPELPQGPEPEPVLPQGPEPEPEPDSEP